MGWITHRLWGQRDWNKESFLWKIILKQISSVKYSSSVWSETLMTFLYISLKRNFLKGNFGQKLCSVCIYTLTRCNIPEYLAFVAECAYCPGNGETSASKVFESTSLKLHRVTAIKTCHVTLVAPRTHCQIYLQSMCVLLCLHCWVVICITEVQYKWCKYIGRCGWAVTVNSIRLIDCMGFCCMWLSCYCEQCKVNWLHGLCCVWLSCYFEQYKVNWLHGLMLCVVELLLWTV